MGGNLASRGSNGQARDLHAAPFSLNMEPSCPIPPHPSRRRFPIRPRRSALYNLYTSDEALQEAVKREGAAAHGAQLARDGAAIGSAASFEHGQLANRHPPVLQSFNVRGERIDALEFHPSWHALMEGIAARGLSQRPVGARRRPGRPRRPRGARRGLFDAGAGRVRHAVPDHHDLRRHRGHAPGRRARSATGCRGCSYATLRPARSALSRTKRGGLIGMGMTEKQGGSDVRANTTRAERTADGSYRINGA